MTTVEMAPWLRKLVLTTHIAASVGWFGALMAYLAVAVAAANGLGVIAPHATWMVLGLIGWWVIVPLAAISMVTGLVNSLASRWGLIRHYWVLCKFAITAFATAILLLHMPSVTSATAIRAVGSRGFASEIFHAAGGIVLLLLVLVLAVYRPTGMTRYGWRKLREESAGRR